MSAQEIAQDCLDQWRTGKFAEAGERCQTDDVDSFEAAGDER